jgi:hypothetical protein
MHRAIVVRRERAVMPLAVRARRSRLHAVLGAPVRARVDDGRWAATRAALFVRIDWVVLELVVEAQVVHALEHVVLAAGDGHRPSAALADWSKLLVSHNRRWVRIFWGELIMRRG